MYGFTRRWLNHHGLNGHKRINFNIKKCKALNIKYVGYGGAVSVLKILKGDKRNKKKSKERRVITRFKIFI